MCGIVGLYLKDPSMREGLGALFAPMLIEMTDRGPDSAGVAVYRPPLDDARSRITLFSPTPGYDWDALVAALEAATGASVTFTRNGSHAVLLTDAEPAAVADTIATRDDSLQMMSAGSCIEIYKETGTPSEVADEFGIARMQGTHAVGHTRMATESAVTTAGSHPYSTGRDLCLVHNGSLSNHNRLRQRLRDHEHRHFATENDTEVGAAYISSRLDAGRSLHGALEDSLTDLDGFYTFVAGTADGFAVLRDPIACKPAVLAETDRYVAFGSEYRALATLPDVEHARVWEPEPAVVYSWGSAA